MDAAITHDCGAVIGPGDHDTYRTEQRSIAWEGSHSDPDGGGSATIYEFDGECPVCGGELDPSKHRAKVVD